MKDLLFKNAQEKLEREKKSVTTSDAATLIQDKVAVALGEFCRQEPKLAEAIIKSGNSFYECCKQIVKDTRSAQYISDLDAYSKAVKFYIKDAEIKYSMSITVGGKKDFANIDFSNLLG